MSEKTLDDFYCQIKEEVSIAYDNDTSGWNKEDFLTSIILDYLDEAGEVSEYVICPFRDRGLQLNAYSFEDDYSTLNLFVTIYSDEDSPKTIPPKEVEAAIRRELQMFRRATNDLHESFNKDNDTYEFAITVHDHKKQITHVHVTAITNGKVKPINFKNTNIDESDISFTLWDIERLYRCVMSGKMRETIEIDFQKEFGITIPCLENHTSDKYTAYLAIFNGEILSQLYSKFRDRLLEKNVRSFLQVRGAVNKGIRTTLREEPDMFLAFNNGISVTAENVQIIRDKDSGLSIKSIKDMQIVNGGQTTASIFTASQDKKYPVDLSKVWVQAKISVIASAEDMDEIVPQISACANTQNKIQVADFSANDPFHRAIEDLSRTIWAPAVNGSKPINWFYERARGQYADVLSRETTTKRRNEFKETHPYFTKTDLAKYESSWDQLPYEVSEGAQKNFKKFTIRLQDDRKFTPDAEYYKRLIAKAILFRSTEKLISQQQYGGYRSNIVTYSISFLSYKTAQRIDLDEIWREQKIPKELETELINISKVVHSFITNAPNGANIGEWCKKKNCWDKLKDCEYELSEDLKSKLIDRRVTGYTSVTKPTKAVPLDKPVTEQEKSLIEEAAQIPANTYFALAKWAKETNNFDGWQRSLLFKVGTLVNRNKTPTTKQAKWCVDLYNTAIEKGFTNK